MIAHRTLLCASVLALAGCGSADTPTTGASAPSSEPTVTTEPATASEIIIEQDGVETGRVMITGDAPQQIVDDLIERVSRELGIDPGEVTVVASFAKTWTDGSLGCAEPGIVRTQREQAGYQVELAAADESWDFRVRDTGEIIVCDDGFVR